MYDQQEKNKHKFMVQSVLAPPDADLTDLYKLVSSCSSYPPKRGGCSLFSLCLARALTTCMFYAIAVEGAGT